MSGDNMKNWLTIFLGVIVFTCLNAGVLKTEKQQNVSNVYMKNIDETVGERSGTLPKVLRNRSLRSPQNTNVTAVLIDSAVHGYGLVVPQTSPTTYVEGNGFFLGYRGWVLEPYTDESGNTSSANNSGFIKAAISEDGLDFTLHSGLNDQIMGPNTQVTDGPLKGRYPSSVANEDYPYVVWTEATLYTGSATNNGGRPMYTFDQLGWNSNYYFSPAIDINFGWYDGVDPTDTAGDLWVNCPVLVDDGSDKAMVVTATQWSSSPDENFPDKSTYVMRSSSMVGAAYFSFGALPELLFDVNDLESTGTTSQTSMDINENGIGYAMCTGYLADSTISERHNFIIKKTEDYGETWSSTGLEGQEFYFLPDTTLHRVFVESGFLPDTINFYSLNDTTDGDTTWTDTTWTIGVSPGVFPLYDHEVQVDSDGTLHIITTMVVESETPGYIWVSLTGSGLYHLESDDPSNPGSWRASQIAELSNTFGFNGMPDGNGGGNYFNVFGTSAISKDNNDVMYAGYHALGDTSAAGFNWDIFVAKSYDGGASWNDPENITMTGGLQEDEMYVHLAPTATDTNCFMVYQQPNYTQNHLSDPANMAAFQQNFWFATYGNTITVGIEDEEMLPGSFSLKQNYPNPFNPATSISYTVGQTGHVEMKLYNVMGQLVKTLVNEELKPGDYSFILQADDLASGIYFYKMTQHGQTLTRKLALLK